VVIALASVSSAAGLLVLITLTRGLGQSALSVVSLAMPGKWFRRRLTWAMGVYALVTSIGFMVAFPAVGALVQARGWRIAWAAVGAALILGLAPLAWLFIRREPENNFELEAPDVRAIPAGTPTAEPPTRDRTLSEALCSPAFWVFAVASSLYGLVASGIGLFNESILAERGFPPDVYYTALAATAITALVGNFVAGAWADRASLKRVLVAALLLMAGALVALPHVSTTVHVMGQAVAMGVAGGSVMVVFFSFWGKAYGRTHLGKIQGVAQAFTVLASAVGPLLLARWSERTGTYGGAFYALAATLTLLAMAALIVPVPASAESPGNG
jgi:MFS family permease